MLYAVDMQSVPWIIAIKINMVYNIEQAFNPIQRQSRLDFYLNFKLLARI